MALNEEDIKYVNSFWWVTKTKPTRCSTQLPVVAEK